MGFLRDNLDTHLGSALRSLFGEPYAGLMLGAGVVAIVWLMLLWLYRKGLFIRL